VSGKKHAWTWLWVALGLALVIRTGVRDRGVITDHLEFGHRVLSGLELYAPFEGQPLHPPYPPGFGLLTGPFSWLPERAARFAWGIAQVLSLAAIGAWLLTMLRRLAPALEEKRHLILLITAAVGSRFILRDTHGGGGNLINLALSLSALALAEKGRERGAGWLLGFSLATKPTHILMLPLLCWMGRWRAAGHATVAALAFTGLSLLTLGQGTAPLEQWAKGTWQYSTADNVFAEPAHGFPEFSWMNQSLRCAVARYAGDVPPRYADQVPGWVPGAGLDNVTTAWITRLLTAGLLLATALAAARSRPSGAALTAAVLCLSLMLSPISWKAHHVALIPAFSLLVIRGMEGRRWAWWFLLGYAALCLPGEEITGKSLKQLQQSCYFVTLGTVSVWLLCLTKLDRARRDLPNR